MPLIPTRWIGINRWLQAMWLLIACVVLIIIHGLVWFTQQIPQQPLTSATKVDAVVVLAGGSLRIQHGLERLLQRRAKHLYVSGAGSGNQLATMAQRARRSVDQLPCCITIDHEAQNTYQNAELTAAWLQQNNYQSVLLVTANYHMPRAMLLFAHHAPHIAVTADPVFPRQFNAQKWWEWPTSTVLVLGEYGKYLWLQAWLNFIQPARLWLVSEAE